MSPPSSSRSSVGANERICSTWRGSSCDSVHVAAIELRLGDRLRRVVRHVEEEVVGVAEDDRPAERSETVEHLAGLAAALHGVAETDDLLDPEPLELCDHCGERGVVAVDVRDERERHGSTIGRR